LRASVARVTACSLAAIGRALQFPQHMWRQPCAWSVLPRLRRRMTRHRPHPSVSCLSSRLFAAEIFDVLKIDCDFFVPSSAILGVAVAKPFRIASELSERPLRTGKRFKPRLVTEFEIFCPAFTRPGGQPARSPRTDVRALPLFSSNAPSPKGIGTPVEPKGFPRCPGFHRHPCCP